MALIKSVKKKNLEIEDVEGLADASVKKEEKPVTEESNKTDDTIADLFNEIGSSDGESEGNKDKQSKKKIKKMN
jgi:hypothetical protein